MSRKRKTQRAPGSGHIKRRMTKHGLRYDAARRGTPLGSGARNKRS